jgi:hypothetical protein
MKFDDAIYNWVQIEMVAQGRPDDVSAVDTRNFFNTLLLEDFQVTDIAVSKITPGLVHVHYTRDGEVKENIIPRAAAEQLLQDINANPAFDAL